MNDEDLKLATALQNLGSTREQAETMARQLIKRAEQIAEDRGIPPAEALGYLLNLVIQGSRGETPAGFEGRKTSRGEQGN